MEPVQFSPEAIRPPTDLSRAAAGGMEREGPSFKETFQNYLDEVNALQLRADEAVRDLATGKVDNLHEIIVAVSEADLSFRLMMEVRNKLLEAYKEIMRMQV